MAHREEVLGKPNALALDLYYAAVERFGPTEEQVDKSLSSVSEISNATGCWLIKRGCTGGEWFDVPGTNLRIRVTLAQTQRHYPLVTIEYTGSDGQKHSLTARTNLWARYVVGDTAGLYAAGHSPPGTPSRDAVCIEHRCDFWQAFGNIN